VLLARASDSAGGATERRLWPLVHLAVNVVFLVRLTSHTRAHIPPVDRMCTRHQTVATWKAVMPHHRYILLLACSLHCGPGPSIPTTFAAHKLSGGIDQLLAFPPALDALPLPLPALPAPPALTAPPAFKFLASPSASLFPRQSDTQSSSAAATPPTLCAPDALGSPASQLGRPPLLVREPFPAATPSARASRPSPAEPLLTSCLFAPSGAHASSWALRDLHASSALVSQSRT
jgi:hypothetical protein